MEAVAGVDWGGAGIAWKRWLELTGAGGDRVEAVVGVDWGGAGIGWKRG